MTNFKVLASLAPVALFLVLGYAAVNVGEYFWVASVPPLLTDATGDGDWLGCKPEIYGNQRSPTSPELERRLAAQFPRGTPEAKLDTTLREQGFVTADRCSVDPTIVHRHFRKSGFPTDLIADVYWKADRHRRIMWLHGYVSIEGL